MKLRLTCIVLVTICSIGNAQKNSAYQQAIQASRDSIHALMKRNQIPGVALTVSVNGKIISSEGFGYADLEQKVSVNPAKTKFRIGSISKALTAAGLAKLYEQKKIILDSSLYFYLPGFPKHQYRPTIRQLAGHIAGVRHYKGNEWYNTQHYNTVSEGLAMFKDDSLNFRPGNKYQYTSHGFNLLSAAMEKAAGKDFISFMSDEVFTPLQLTNTTADLNDNIIEYRTRFYDVKDHKWVNAPYVDNSYKWAGGGFISSAEDIEKFGRALLGESFLRKETIQYFTTPQKLNDGSFTTYGMGFFSGKDHKQKSYFGHSGGSVGGTTDMVIYPNEKVVVVILTNLSGANLGAMARYIANLYMPKSK
jgi:serine beta-lactamase-like protein LACTB, mitochondrial